MGLQFESLGEKLAMSSQKMRPGDYARKMYFLGRDVQNEKIGGITKKVFYYNQLKCPAPGCDKICRTSFGKAMHIERCHPDIKNGIEQFEEPPIVENSNDENEEPLPPSPNSESNIPFDVVDFNERAEILPQEPSSSNLPIENQPEIENGDSSNEIKCD